MKTEIAVIGIAGRFPGAPDVQALWQNLCQGKEAVRMLTDAELTHARVNERALMDPDYVKAAAFLDDVELFDAPFFGISAREAEIMDPQHRIFLECAWEAMEAAGYAGQYGSRVISIYAGCTMNTYLPCNLLQNPSAIESLDVHQLNLGNSPDFLATRVSYKLGLQGSSQTIQCACSTSLVAVHHACQSILRGECELALAGGVSVNLKLRHGYKYTQGGIVSPDGHCRPFDQNAKGTIFASGVGIVVLKQLEAALRDRDMVHAVIKGSAVNNDGSLKVGYTAPSIDGQAKVIIEALANADVQPNTVGYVEAHGTGTSLGDPIELQALTRAFGICRSKKNSCAIGSIKGNLGHLDAAAGVTGLIKTIFVLKHGLIPPTLHFTRPNPKMAIDETPFYVNTELKRWGATSHRRRAGVSSFGVGGTNAHVVLEEAPPIVRDCNRKGQWELLILSARSQAALHRMSRNLGEYLKQQEEVVDLGDVAYTLRVGRKTFLNREFAVCRTTREAAEVLTDPEGQSVRVGQNERWDRPVVFLFGGESSSRRPVSGKRLYDEGETFRKEVDRCSESLKVELGQDLRNLLHESNGEYTRHQLTNLTGVVIFMTEYALARQWMSWGVTPAAMLGYGVGEYVAACVAGVFSVEEAMKLLAARDHMIEKLPAGKMLTIGLSETEAEALRRAGVWIAAVNGPLECVLSGDGQLLKGLSEELQEDGVHCQWIETSRALYSGMMEPMLDQFEEQVRKLHLKPPRIPFLSNVTGKWITLEEAQDPSYWVRHTQATIRFADGIGTLLEDSQRILLDLSSGHALTRLARQQRRSAQQLECFSSLSSPEADISEILGVLGQLWLSGAKIDWTMFDSRSAAGRLPLPTYPFMRQRYWIEASHHSSATKYPDPQSASLSKNPDLLERPEFETQVVQEDSRLHERPPLKTAYVPPCDALEAAIADIFQRALSVSRIGVEDNFFDLGGDSLMALQVIGEMKKMLDMEVPVVNLYEHLTIRSLAASLNHQEVQQAAGSNSSCPLPTERMTTR